MNLKLKRLKAEKVPMRHHYGRTVHSYMVNELAWVKLNVSSNCGSGDGDASNTTLTDPISFCINLVKVRNLPPS